MRGIKGRLEVWVPTVSARRSAAFICGVEKSISGGGKYLQVERRAHLP